MSDRPSRKNGQEITHRAASWQHRGNVALPAPTVDRDRGDSHNILGVIIDKKENDLYTIATRHGILSNKYTRADFTLCPQQLLKDSDINRDKHVSLREDLKCTAFGGQGFSNVSVQPSRKKCSNLKCKCFKAQLKCRL